MFITLETADNHRLPAYLAKANGAQRGNVIILQEIFGVTAFTQQLADHYASLGYRALVPAMFSRQTSDLSIPYNDMERGRNLAMACKPKELMIDIQAAVDYLNNSPGVAVIGFCWGGTQAFLSACELPINAAVAYYGTAIHKSLNRVPVCPLLMHFGADDPLVPEAERARIAAALPASDLHIYDAGHAFANSERSDHYNPAASTMAEERTLAFLAKHLPGKQT